MGSLHHIRPTCARAPRRDAYRPVRDLARAGAGFAAGTLTCSDIGGADFTAAVFAAGGLTAGRFSTGGGATVFTCDGLPDRGFAGGTAFRAVCLAAFGLPVGGSGVTDFTTGGLETTGSAPDSVCGANFVRVDGAVVGRRAAGDAEGCLRRMGSPVMLEMSSS